MKKRWFALLLTILILSLYSCEKPVVEDAAPVVEDPAPPVVEIPPEPQFAVNPLTGTTDLDFAYEKTRPVAIMINNLKQALPQMGVLSADIIYEAIAEGGITRLLAIYQNPYKVSMIGSVRSARHYFLDLAQNHNAVFLHYGGSPQAYKELKIRKINSFDGITNSTLFYRDSLRQTTMGKEHSAMTSGERIRQAIDSARFEKNMAESFPKMLRFNETETPAGTLPTTFLKISYSPTSIVSYKYDEQSGNYLRFQYNNMPHVDGLTHEQLNFKNVLILYCKTTAIANDKEGRLDLDLISEGSGYYFSFGTYCKIRWSKTSHSTPFALSLEDGSPLLVNPGKTMINIVPLSSKLSLES